MHVQIDEPREQRAALPVDGALRLERTLAAAAFAAPLARTEPIAVPTVITSARVFGFDGQVSEPVDVWLERGEIAAITPAGGEEGEHGQSSRTYSNSSGRLSMPFLGAAIQFAILPGP